ncbi:MAG: type II secretion system protein [bacterium]
MREAFSTSRRGFTLIELLTVVAIIAILVGLISVAVVSAQEHGNATYCRNNLKELGTLIYDYTATYGGYLPAFWHERWVGELGLVGDKWGNLPDDLYGRHPDHPVERGDHPMTTVWNNFSPTKKWLPGNQDRFPVRSGAPLLVCKSDNSGFRCDQGCFVSYLGLAKYGWWHRGNTKAQYPNFQYHQIQEFDNTTRRILLMESEPGTWQFGGCGCRWHTYRHPVWILQRHFGGGNVVFFDGHVQLVQDDEKRKISYWEPDYDQVNPGW